MIEKEKLEAALKRQEKAVDDLILKMQINPLLLNKQDYENICNLLKAYIDTNKMFLQNYILQLKK
jgi:hypothetical protein